MSKAEDLSKQYKDFREQCGVKDPVMLNEIEEAYFEGYHQAEKDLELTWENMECIIKHYQDIMAEKSRMFVRAEDYKELLKRFKERKGNTNGK